MGASEHYSCDVAFSPSVNAQPRVKGSWGVYERLEQAASGKTVIAPGLEAFKEATTRIFLASANSACQSYILHQGRPAGFLRVLGESTLVTTEAASLQALRGMSDPDVGRAMGCELGRSTSPRDGEGRDVAAAHAERDQRIAALETELAQWRGAAEKRTP